MLDFVLDHVKAIKTFTQDSDNGVRDFEISNDEWTRLDDLRNTLKIFKLATLYFSSEEPTVADVILAIDKIDKFLATSIIKMEVLLLCLFSN
ncbi:hypothetical protein V5O48_016530 [Marasmius crinis-equi]|uniref:Uncharacterized protein n=1 Tax=Marasmius crinis-equi TaxID=585013 RepID=A0ABR3ERJ5_9AGAR